MKKKTLLLCSTALLLIPFITFAQRPAKRLVKVNPQKVLRTSQDSASYALGMDIVKTLDARNVDFSPEILAMAIMKESYLEESLLSEEEVNKYLGLLQEDMEKKEAKAKKEAFMKNQQEGLQFLVDNKKKPGVVQTPSGLQYKVIREGEGESPTKRSTVRVHYRGTFINGETFDSSYDRGESVEFPLNGVIKGWTEGLQLMKPGAKYMFYIPHQLAYGEEGMGPIPGGSTLIFEVELISVVN
ncbi:MAG: peptidylprolyl isomerase [Bacteroidetes bacterium]|nr:MAG: peptidylprolyl isomerase [Bacteroidota bacterium]